MNKCINGIMRQSGLTLIELMIVIVIISSLAAISYPYYQEQARETRRAEGAAALTRIMDMQERYYSNRFPPSYANNITLLGYSTNPYVTDNGYYSITAGLCDDPPNTITACVKLTADALNDQDNDGDLTLDSRGEAFRGTERGWGD